MVEYVFGPFDDEAQTLCSLVNAPAFREGEFVSTQNGLSSLTLRHRYGESRLAFW